jgi:hypothetical protein
MTFTTTARAARDSNLNLCRKGLVFEFFINGAGKHDRVLFAIPAHVGAKACLDKLNAGSTLGFCKRAQISDDPGHIVRLKTGEQDTLA